MREGRDARVLHYGLAMEIGNTYDDSSVLSFQKVDVREGWWDGQQRTGTEESSGTARLSISLY